MFVLEGRRKCLPATEDVIKLKVRNGKISDGDSVYVLDRGERRGFVREALYSCLDRRQQDLSGQQIEIGPRSPRA